MKGYSLPISTSLMVLLIIVSAIYILLLQYPSYLPNFRNNKTTSNEHHNNLQKAISNKDSGYKASSLPGIDINSPVKILSSSSFPSLLEAAKSSSRKRKMVDLTKEPTKNSMQTLLNTWYAAL